MMLFILLYGNRGPLQFLSTVYNWFLLRFPEKKKGGIAPIPSHSGETILIPTGEPHLF